MRFLYSTAFVLTMILAYCVGTTSNDRRRPNLSRVSFSDFLVLANDLETYRLLRLVDIDKFNKYAEDKNTIILDTRSKNAYDDAHIKGAVHLNFSDFTEEKLAKVIPSKHTRILIYCNNNIESPMEALLDKSGALALNIPTFINLHGYGYKNIYELDGYLHDYDDRLNLVVAEWEETIF